MSKLAEMVGWFEICLAVIISVMGSWVVLKQDIARLETKVAYVEEASRHSIEANKELSKAITDLTVVLAELRVEMGNMKEGLDRLER